MTRRIPVVVLVLVLLVAVPATAQTRQQERLKGVTAVQIVTESIDDANASCGITETGLTTTASKALLDNGVRVVGDLTLGIPILYVNINTQAFEDFGLCVSNVALELYVTVLANPDHSEQWVSGDFILAHLGGMVSSSTSDHGQAIRDSVFRRTEAIAVDIRIANQ